MFDIHQLPIYEVAGVIAIAVIVGVAAFARRLGVAAPILLVLVGVGLSYLPGLPEIEVPPEFVLDVLLPPILYVAAIRLPFVDFRRNLGTILSLSVVLVVVTAFGTGLTLYVVLARAVVRPPASHSVPCSARRTPSRRPRSVAALGLPPRILVVLEGEGLVNDATALVLFSTAVAIATQRADRRRARRSPRNFLVRGRRPRSRSDSSSAS